MRVKTSAQSPRHRRQRGFALMALLAIIATGMLYFLVRQLDASAMQRRQDEVTTQSLAQAKEALIAWSVMNTTTPGRLPCPEDTNKIGSDLEGQAKLNCSNTLPTVGRLPWRTLGIGQLRGGDGEPLWYGLSPGFRSAPINSNSVGLLTIDGVSNSAVAIVIAPGPPLAGQSRPPINAATPPLAANYLDSTNGDGDTSFVTSGSSTTFNDHVLTISSRELFSTVPRRIADEFRGYPGRGLKGFFDTNNFLPCAAAVSLGSQVPGDNTGFFPFADITFDPNAYNLLKDNQWTDIASYSALNCGTVGANSATVTIGGQAVLLTFP